LMGTFRFSNNRDMWVFRLMGICFFIQENKVYVF
jgi:hypothetical protein